MGFSWDFDGILPNKMVIGWDFHGILSNKMVIGWDFHGMMMMSLSSPVLNEGSDKYGANLGYSYSIHIPNKPFKELLGGSEPSNSEPISYLEMGWNSILEVS